MPVYEYVCKECKRKFSWLKGVVADEGKPVCPRCGSQRYRRIISRVFRARSDEESLENFGNNDFEDLDDPRQAKRFAKHFGREFRDELGEDFEDEIDAAIEEESKTDDFSEEY